MFRLKAIWVIVLIGLLTYFNALFNGFFLSDDEDQIVNNPQIHSLQNLPQLFTGSTYYRSESDESYGLFYRPLMLSAYSIIYAAFGPDPLFFHLFQIGLHIANSWLIFLVFRRFVSRSGALIASLVFLVHPINSETVLHAANLQDVLFLFFGLLSLKLVSRPRLQANYRNLFVFGVLLLLSFFAKETGLVFAGLALTYLCLFQKEKLKPYVVASSIAIGIYCLFRFKLAGVGLEPSSISVMATLSLSRRLLLLPLIIAIYLKTTFFPLELNAFQMWPIQPANVTNFALPLLALVLGGYLAWWAYQKIIKRGDKQTTRAFQFFLLWFALGLGMHLQLIPLEQQLAERWFYLPLIGLLGMIAIITSNLKVKLKPATKMVVWGSLILLLATRTIVRSFDWRDSKTLLEHDIVSQPHNYYLQNLLSSVYIREADYAKAQPLVQASVATHPYFGNVSNLAIINLHLKNYSEAQKLFEQAISLNGNYQTHLNFSNFLLYVTQDYSKALELTAAALKKYPQSWWLLVNLAQAHYYLGNDVAALAAAQTAYQIEVNPLTTEALNAIEQHRDPQTSTFIEGLPNKEQSN